MIVLVVSYCSAETFRCNTNVDMSSNSIVNISTTPVLDSDVTAKVYVDLLVRNSTTSAIVDLKKSTYTQTGSVTHQNTVFVSSSIEASGSELIIKSDQSIRINSGDVTTLSFGGVETIEFDAGGVDMKEGFVKNITTTPSAGYATAKEYVDYSVKQSTTDLATSAALALLDGLTLKKDGSVELTNWWENSSYGLSVSSIGINTNYPSNSLEVVGDRDYLTVRLSRNKANNQTQRLGLVGQHYSATEQPISLIAVYADTNLNSVNIGGGAGSASNAATGIQFFTAANNTTVAGTERMRIEENGDIGINDDSPSYKLDVDGTGRFTGAVTTGGSDPPYTQYWAETTTSVVKYINANVPPQYLNGATMYFNKTREQFEYIRADIGEVRNFHTNELVEMITPIVETFPTEDEYSFNPDTGDVVKWQNPHNKKKWKLNDGYEFDRTDGNFYEVVRDTNNVIKWKTLKTKSKAVKLK